MSIKAVAFDYGGVISLPQDEKAMEDMGAIVGIEAGLMGRIYWDNRAIYDQGLVSGREFFRNILADAGIFPDDTAIEGMIERDLESWSRINGETEQLMKDVKKAGLKLGILSNMVQPFLDRVRTGIPAFSLPDAAVYSCEVDTVKPEKKIYLLLLAALDCGPEELVFFDDTEVNIRGAEKLGIRGFLWESPERARRELEKLCPEFLGG